jgi:transposase-like protein
MAGRATYTDDHKASVYVVLASNEGNVKRTSRDTGVPISTIRRWRDEWERLDSLPDPVALEKAVGDFTERATTLRDKALDELERQLHTAKPGDLIKIIGILDDKITRSRGLADRTVEHRHVLPSADELHALVTGFAEASRQTALTRAADIIDAEVVEQAPQRALLPG